MKKTTDLVAAALVAVLLAIGISAQASETYGPVRRGDNLWTIAREVYPDQGVTRDQAMLVLFRANPQAFGSRCNLNSPLQTGVVLEAPPLTAVRALSPEEARHELQRQAREWQAHLRTGRSLVCPPVSKAPAAAPRVPSATPAQQPSASAPESAPAPSASPSAAPPAPPPRTHPQLGPPAAQPVAPLREPRAGTAAPAVHEPSAPPQGQRPTEQPQRKAAPQKQGEWPRVWGEIESEFVAHEPLDWLAIPIVLALIAAVFLWYRRKRTEGARAPAEAVTRPAVDFSGLSAAETVERLKSNSVRGLTAPEARRRLDELGPNALTERQATLLERVLQFFWGPIPWMIEVAAILSALVGHWADLAIILTLLVFNAVIGFWQEFKAANALQALKQQLALKARVLREGRWRQIDAADLVPGDVIRLRLGAIIPADAKLIEGDYLAVDQSALTGESLPVDKKAGEIAYSGSVAKQGEMLAVVTATGDDTFFGRTAKLVQGAGAVSHFQKAVLAIGDYLIYLSLALVAVLIIVQLFRQAPLLNLVEFALILTVASIPVAMPAVLSVTMAVGALALSKMKAIVSRLQSIEEMAGIDVLCSDKTGTLTQNKLTLGEPEVFAAADAQDLILAAALASRAEDQDAIDLAVIGGLTDANALDAYTQSRFVPFDPVGKRTEAEITASDGVTFKVTKGAPQVILALSDVVGTDAERADKQVQDLAAKGFRTLGVARADASGSWRFLGILPLFDPPREDSEETIRQAGAHGIAVKMVTGDNAAIAREIASRLGLGTAIQPVDELVSEAATRGHLSSNAAERIEQADGFAQVFPEHKYAIVKALQERGHLVAMTGDGVNDAPALKQADVGIAVSGATDAARAAAALVLTAPGLSTIVSAVEEARRIFERMNSYAIYRVIETIRIMCFMVAAMLVYRFYPITAIMIILLALLNDIPIMAIAYDNTWLDPKPVRWQMHQVLTIATVLGLIGVVETFLLLMIAYSWLGIGLDQVQTIIFLKLSVAGHLTLFVARTKRPMLSRPFPAPLLAGAILATQIIAALIAGFGILIASIPWTYIALIWVYCLIWVVVEDRAKLSVYNRLRRTSAHHRSFLDTVGYRVHAQSSH